MIHFPKPFLFGSKAETLYRLRGQLQQSKVPEFIYFSVQQWRDDRQATLDLIEEKFVDEDVIVRSSAQNEDGELYAHAGAFLSVLHIGPRDRERLGSVIDEVIASYQLNERTVDENPSDQVLIQSMVRDVSMSGVLFTYDLNTGAPYYVINYDDETGSTETVTSGTSYSNRTLYVYRELRGQVSSSRFRNLLDAVAEIEQRTGDKCLDVEFALDGSGQVYILQVRRITTQSNWNRSLELRIGDALVRMQEAARPRLISNASDFDQPTLFGKMPDWNPAEMIGNAPRRLAFSLYRLLITDSAWREARAAMGYHEPRGQPLMVSLAGQPYIDVRQSFRSYIPADVPPTVAERLVQTWLSNLAQNPHLHDKVEFDVAITAFSFDYDDRFDNRVPKDLLSEAEKFDLRESFRRLTIDLVEGRRASISDQDTAIGELERRHAAVLSKEHLHPSLQLVAQLLEDAITFGTIPFSILARHAFIAKTLLDSLMSVGVFTDDEVKEFYRSVPTVAGEFVEDIERFGRGELSEAGLIERYGHLRPGTYDLLSWRYDQRGVKTVSSGETGSNALNRTEPFELTDTQRECVNRLLKQEGFSIDAESLMTYIAKAIQRRESAKFAFSRNISDALEVVAAWGSRIGLSRDELSHVDIRDILDCMVETKGRSLHNNLRSLSESNRQDHEVTAALRLPYLISRPSDLVIVPMNVEQPNFVTLRSVSGRCVQVTGRDLDPEKLDGGIVAIESADPGFDWIFTRPILGLVTKFGGANSHMAIRCAEFDIPAAIGCGEQIYERLVGCGYIELDCAVGRIEPSEH